MFKCFRGMVLVFVLGAYASAPGAFAAVAVKVDGDEITDVEVQYLAKVQIEYKGDLPLPEDVKAKAIQTAVVNHVLYQKAVTEIPSAIEYVSRAAMLEVSREYYSPYAKTFARPVVEKKVTLESVLPEIPMEPDSVFLLHLSMADRDALEKVRADILAKKIGFEEAAKKYSTGLSASKGGEVGWVPRTDDRYLSTTRDILFAAKTGEVTGIVEERLGPAIFLVKENISGWEKRFAQAKESLPGFVETEIRKYVWDRVVEYRDANPGSYRYDDKKADDIAKEGDFVVFILDGVNYKVKDVLARSGGGIHGGKDLSTIVENSFRDMVIQKLYVEKQGSIDGAALRHKAMTEHYAARIYLQWLSRDLKVVDQEVATYIKDNQAKYDLPARADIGVIYVRNKSRLDLVMERLKTESFEDVAGAWSQLTKYAGVQGRLGIVSLSDVKGDTANVKEGELTEPFEVKDGDLPGFYIMKIYKYYGPEVATIQNLSEQTLGGIRSIIMSKKKGELYTRLLKEVLREKKVVLM